MSGARYTDFLSNDLPVLLEDITLDVRQRMVFQQDGAPPHYCILARNKLTELFHQNWIGRGGPVPWPARAPDLTPMDYFVWGTVKEIVFKECPTTPEDMMERIRNAFQQINETNMASRVLSNFQKRIRICIQEEGRQFEHLL